MPKTPIWTGAFSVAEGVNLVINEGDVFADDHPYVKAHPELFKDHDVDVIAAPPKRSAKVEQASAAPGETREVAAPAKTRKFGTVTDL